MKPPPFGYVAPRTVEEALRALAEGPPGTKVLAGGQSLLPILSMRLAAPARLVDINRVTALDTVRVDATGVTVGALARHARVEQDDAAAAAVPLLRQALRLVAHPVIRNRGTTVGSLVHADPAAELPAVLALTGGSVRLATTERTRTVPAAEFFRGPLESAVEPGELALSAHFPRLPKGTRTAFLEVARRHGDYALCGVAAAVTAGPDGAVTAARVACLAVAPVPLVVDVTDAARERDERAAADLVRAAVDPDDDIHATAAYRRHLAGVLTVRALRSAAPAGAERAA